MELWAADRIKSRLLGAEIITDEQGTFVTVPTCDATAYEVEFFDNSYWIFLRVWDRTYGLADERELGFFSTPEDAAAKVAGLIALDQAYERMLDTPDHWEQ